MRKFLANSIIKSFHILVYNNVHIMTLIYDESKFYWAAVAYKRLIYYFWQRYHTFALEFWTKNRLFLRPQLYLKSKTNTNHQRIGCLVLPWNYPNKWTVPSKRFRKFKIKWLIDWIKFFNPDIQVFFSTRDSRP